MKKHIIAYFVIIFVTIGMIKLASDKAKREGYRDGYSKGNIDGAIASLEGVSRVLEEMIKENDRIIAELKHEEVCDKDDSIIIVPPYIAPTPKQEAITESDKNMVSAYVGYGLVGRTLSPNGPGIRVSDKNDMILGLGYSRKISEDYWINSVIFGGNSKITGGMIGVSKEF